ncbi:MAG: hypothetical protein LM573_07110 [Thermofilum sp.]|nr:hypothetical protein [Thermofilum sp.]
MERLGISRNNLVAILKRYLYYYVILVLVLIFAPYPLMAVSPGLVKALQGAVIIAMLLLPLHALGELLLNGYSLVFYDAGLAMKTLVFPATFSFLFLPFLFNVTGWSKLWVLPLWLFHVAYCLDSLGSGPNSLKPEALGKTSKKLAGSVSLIALYYSSIAVLIQYGLPTRYASIWLSGATVYAVLSVAPLLTLSKRYALNALSKGLDRWTGKFALLAILLSLLDILASEPLLEPFREYLRYASLSITAGFSLWLAYTIYKITSFDPARYSHEVYEKLHLQVKPVGPVAGLAEAIRHFIEYGEKEELLVRLAHYAGSMDVDADETVKALKGIIDYFENNELPWNPDEAKRIIEERIRERANLVEKAFNDLARLIRDKAKNR